MRRRTYNYRAAAIPPYPTRSLLSSLINAGPAVAYACKVSSDCGMIAVAENVSTLLGYAPEEFLADPGFWAVRIHPADSTRVFDEMPRLFQGGSETVEYRFRHADGRYLWLRDQMELKFDASGKPDRIIGLWIDVTGLKMAKASAAQIMGGNGQSDTTESRGEDYAKQT